MEPVKVSVLLLVGVVRVAELPRPGSWPSFPGKQARQGNYWVHLFLLLQTGLQLWAAGSCSRQQRLT